MTANAQSAKSEKHTFSQRWAPELAADGYVQISTYFLENYHRLKPYSLTHSEALFVIHVMQHKWGAAAPFPAYKTIAERMGISIKSARRLGKSLEDKGYLKREFRIGNTNLFHWNKLIATLVAHKTGATDAKTKRARGRAKP